MRYYQTSRDNSHLVKLSDTQMGILISLQRKYPFPGAAFVNPDVIPPADGKVEREAVIATLEKARDGVLEEFNRQDVFGKTSMAGALMQPDSVLHDMFLLDKATEVPGWADASHIGTGYRSVFFDRREDVPRRLESSRLWKPFTKSLEQSRNEFGRFMQNGMTKRPGFVRRVVNRIRGIDGDFVTPLPDAERMKRVFSEVALREMRRNSEPSLQDTLTWGAAHYPVMNPYEVLEPYKAYTYYPEPADTRGVALGKQEEAFVKLYAAALHSDWYYSRLEELKSDPKVLERVETQLNNLEVLSGFDSKEEAKEVLLRETAALIGYERNPQMTSWDKLDDAGRAAAMSQAEETVKFLKSKGYDLDKSLQWNYANVDDDPLCPGTERFEAIVELVAENAHEVWAKDKIADGWVYGHERDNQLKTHPMLKAYDELPESEKEYDRKVGWVFQEVFEIAQDSDVISVIRSPLKRSEERKELDSVYYTGEDAADKRRDFMFAQLVNARDEYEVFLGENPQKGFAGAKLRAEEKAKELEAEKFSAKWQISAREPGLEVEGLGYLSYKELGLMSWHVDYTDKISESFEALRDAYIKKIEDKPELWLGKDIRTLRGETENWKHEWGFASFGADMSYMLMKEAYLDGRSMQEIMEISHAFDHAGLVSESRLKKEGIVLPDGGLAARVVALKEKTTADITVVYPEDIVRGSLPKDVNTTLTRENGIRLNGNLTMEVPKEGLVLVRDKRNGEYMCYNKQTLKGLEMKVEKAAAAKSVAMKQPQKKTKKNTKGI